MDSLKKRELKSSIENEMMAVKSIEHHFLASSDTFLFFKLNNNRFLNLFFLQSLNSIKESKKLFFFLRHSKSTVTLVIVLKMEHVLIDLPKKEKSLVNFWWDCASFIIINSRFTINLIKTIFTCRTHTPLLAMGMDAGCFYFWFCCCCCWFLFYYMPSIQLTHMKYRALVKNEKLYFDRLAAWFRIK